MDASIGKIQDVPSIQQLNDGSWELCVRKSMISTVQEKIQAMFPGSNVDINYDPTEPTAADLELCMSDYEQAKWLCGQQLLERSIKILKRGWSPAAGHYQRYVENTLGPDRHRPLER